MDSFSDEDLIYLIASVNTTLQDSRMHKTIEERAKLNGLWYRLNRELIGRRNEK
jgi:hypothetical protein